MRLRVAAVIALLVPLPLMAWGAGRAADQVGRWIGAAIARVTASLPEPARSEVEAWGPNEAGPEAELVPAEEIVALEHKAEPSRAKASPSSPAKIAGGIRVRAAKVLALAKRRMVPSGAPVPAEGARPAGIQLSGVGGLGVGLRDGDILTHVGGAEARSPGAVIAAATAAWRARAPAVSGRVWRNGEVLSLLVEIPYPKQAAR